LVLAIAATALVPTQSAPRLFNSRAAEHFAAAYLATLFCAAGFRARRLSWLVCILASLAVIMEALKFLVPGQNIPSAQAFASDIAGIFAAVAPLYVRRLRASATTPLVER
jgi:hypothetical protein